MSPSSFLLLCCLWGKGPMEFFANFRRNVYTRQRNNCNDVVYFITIFTAIFNGLVLGQAMLVLSAPAASFWIHLTYAYYGLTLAVQLVRLQFYRYTDAPTCCVCYGVDVVVLSVQLCIMWWTDYYFFCYVWLCNILTMCLRMWYFWSLPFYPPRHPYHRSRSVCAFVALGSGGDAEDDLMELELSSAV